MDSTELQSAPTMAPGRERHRYPAIAVDMIIFTIGADDLLVLLIKRRGEPFAGRWAIPGGFFVMR